MPAKVGSAKRTQTTQTRKTGTSSSRSGASSKTTQAKASSSKSSSTVKQTQSRDSFVKSTPKPNPGTYSKTAVSNVGARKEKEAVMAEHKGKVAEIAKRELKVEKFIKSAAGQTVCKAWETSATAATSLLTKNPFVAPVVEVATFAINSMHKENDKNDMTFSQKVWYTTLAENIPSIYSSPEENKFVNENRKEIDEYKDAHRETDTANG